MKMTQDKQITRTEPAAIKQLLGLFLNELKYDRKRSIFFITFITIGHVFRFVITPLLLSFIIQALVTSPHDLTLAYWLLGGIAISAFFNTYLNDKGYSALFNHEEAAQTRLLERAMDHLMSRSYHFFSDHKVGTLAGEAMNFSRSYTTVLDAYFLQTSQLVIGLVASLIVLAVLAPILVIPLALITTAIIVLNIRNIKERGPYRNERRDRTSKLSGTIADIMGNQILTRVFAREAHELKVIMTERNAIEKIARKEIEIIERESLYRQSVTYTFQIISLFIALWLFQSQMVSVAALVFMVTYLIRTSESIFGISSLIRQYEQAFLDATPMMKILNSSDSVSDAPAAKTLHVSHGAIAFNDVTFTYADSASDSVFNNLNLAVQGGQKIGLAGHSGGGKTTLTKLLLRFADIDGGAITIDGQKIDGVTQTSLRANIAYVPQEPFLFHRSLRENIAYGKPDATDAEIYEAASKAYATDFIDKLPNGLDTVVGERGVKLSGGQRQRVAIARALLKDAPILILDEATSALDSESERYIQQALGELMKGRTSIVIAHRLSTIAKLDRIIVLDNGAIVEDGTHAELLKKKGTYANLWSHQSGGFLED